MRQPSSLRLPPIDLRFCRGQFPWRRWERISRRVVMQADAICDPPSPKDLVVRCLVRSLYRKAAGKRLQRVIVLLGGYIPKLEALGTIFRFYGKHAVMVNPKMASSADALVDFVDCNGVAMEHVVPLLDCAISKADTLNTRLGEPANDPATTCFRTDKYEQQEALRRAGLPAAAQCLTTSADEAMQFMTQLAASRSEYASFSEGSQTSRVVIKPRNAAGGDGIWLCSSESAMRAAINQELGRINVEGNVNKELVVMEVLQGEEWVVNTVSRDGVHKATDVWKGPPKAISEVDGGAQFVYTAQFLADEHPRRAAVLEYTFSCLDAVGLRHGAAHTEIVFTACGPRLLEVNARPAGGLPRTPGKPNQLEAIAMSLYDTERFFALPAVPSCANTSDGQGQSAAVIFLRAPLDGFILCAAVRQIMSLRTFSRFERDAVGLSECNSEKGLALPVKRTIGLFSSPGAVVLLGTSKVIEEDAEAIRAIEAVGYSETYPVDEDASLSH
eukprot:TRINITY_DN26908_c0_g2_i1.p1 TRINITY_DN26908_c0_g2~~TRINITY_DN26908_c0_g2_i1.p1  ORF type:complete len:500 (+),score=75.65 TRINITY_DN26908_c0_g2_i1:31-1530(+)